MSRPSWKKKPVNITLDTEQALWLTFNLRDQADAWKKIMSGSMPDVEPDKKIIFRERAEKNLAHCEGVLKIVEGAIEALS